MSRIGRKPIEIPSGVTVNLEGSKISVRGPKGTLSRELHPDMKVTVDGGTILVERPSDSKKHKSLHGLTRTLINNMVIGVTQGYEKTLELSGVGYRAQMSGNKLILNLGFSKPCEIVPPEGIEIEVPQPNRVIVRGIDKVVVGQVAADIRRLRPPEPYRGTGVRYAGEVIRRKVVKGA
ncbi:MAG: 50S ribosomal protein L6 [Bacillota bacterium]|jgi:large subunit ribosomal protein L6|nr:50S ribosomal protein L6 [Candidatus Fermentithermobacillaceae bacterium]HAF66583.1 50S ribosomal protein L6 [Clostridiales bacterium UBA9857]HOA70882.1 50S ribosomal protein L6 [Bacillota bacterium]HOP71162.1 50S ribosomal protein L6 [Bacillota bacterium]HPT35535.1 50S ribosomal protein L6 [Bacillota bacterium]